MRRANLLVAAALVVGAMAGTFTGCGDGEESSANGGTGGKKDASADGTAGDSGKDVSTEGGCSNATFIKPINGAQLTEADDANGLALEIPDAFDRGMRRHQDRHREIDELDHGADGRGRVLLLDVQVVRVEREAHRRGRQAVADRLGGGRRRKPPTQQPTEAVQRGGDPCPGAGPGGEAALKFRFRNDPGALGAGGIQPPPAQ